MATARGAAVEFADMARKVVRVGSVGTRCWIVLMLGRDASDPLFLQVKDGHHQPGQQGHLHHPAAQHLATGCRAGNPLANVYHEDRLEVRNRCMAVTGTVAYVAHED